MRAYQDAVRRRAVEREPVAYIVGQRGFRHLDLAVDRRALVPRPETELLVEVGLALAAGLRVLDVGTGSGAVALALKDERPDLCISGSDLSESCAAAGPSQRPAAGPRRAVAARGPARPISPMSLTRFSPTFPTSPRPSAASSLPRSCATSPRRRCSPAPTGSRRSARCSRSCPSARGCGSGARGGRRPGGSGRRPGRPRGLLLGSHRA